MTQAQPWEICSAPDRGEFLRDLGVAGAAGARVDKAIADLVPLPPFPPFETMHTVLEQAAE